MAATLRTAIGTVRCTPGGAASLAGGLRARIDSRYVEPAGASQPPSCLTGGPAGRVEEHPLELLLSSACQEAFPQNLAIRADPQCHSSDAGGHDVVDQGRSGCVPDLGLAIGEVPRLVGTHRHRRPGRQIDRDIDIGPGSAAQGREDMRNRHDPASARARIHRQARGGRNDPIPCGDLDPRHVGQEIDQPRLPSQDRPISDDSDAQDPDRGHTIR